MNLKELVKNKLTESQRKKIRIFINYLRTITYGYDLTKLAKIYQTDKWGLHFYTPHYMNHFRKYKFKPINLLEIGVGGYEDPKFGGQSLRMWKRYFPYGKIYSIDIYDKSFLEESRIKIFKGSQVDEYFLENVFTKMEFDIIIDDGSHINEHVIQTFKLLFPKLKKGGIYVIEDTQTSYWQDYGGDSNDLNNSNTLLNYFKGLTDCINYKELIKPDYHPTYFDLNIVSIHFYHNLIFVYKNENIEESNIVVNNQK